MDSKSKLQQKVLALKRGYTAKDIQYICIPVKHDRWRAKLHISSFDFPTTNIFNSKRQAETEAAQKVLDDWSKVVKSLKRAQTNSSTHSQEQQRRRGDHKNTISDWYKTQGSDDDAKWNFEDSEEEEARWDSEEEKEKTLSDADYAKVGKHVHEIYRIFQRDA